jgi:hypothetical protein
MTQYKVDHTTALTDDIIIYKTSNDKDAPLEFVAYKKLSTYLATDESGALVTVARPVCVPGYIKVEGYGRDAYIVLP